MFALTDKAYVVTGAASGLGQAMARALLRQGAQVLMLDQNLPSLDAVTEGRPEAAGRARAVVCDIRDAQGLRQAVDDFGAAAGGIEGLFANAGISGGPGFGIEAGRETGGLQHQDIDHWRNIMDINLYGTVSSMQAVLPWLKKQGRGRMVLTASVAGLKALSLVSYVYEAAKGGVVRLVQQAALELAPHGITVNGIAPGFIKTNIAGGRLYEADTANMLLAQVPMRRLGEASDVEGLAVFLASESSSYITGVVIPVDGGYLLN
jgi:NAD(P)-dependent dehydrogenase (short-subunit alcohol dehydrogenase family)